MKNDSLNTCIVTTLIEQNNKPLYFSVSGKLIDATWFQNTQENSFIVLGKFQIYGSEEVMNLVLFPDPKDWFGLLFFIGRQIKIEIDLAREWLQIGDEVAIPVKAIKNIKANSRSHFPPT